MITSQPGSSISECTGFLVGVSLGNTLQRSSLVLVYPNVNSVRCSIDVTEIVLKAMFNTILSINHYNRNYSPLKFGEGVSLKIIEDFPVFCFFTCSPTSSLIFVDASQVSLVDGFPTLAGDGSLRVLLVLKYSPTSTLCASGTSRKRKKRALVLTGDETLFAQALLISVLQQQYVTNSFLVLVRFVLFGNFESMGSILV